MSIKPSSLAAYWLYEGNWYIGLASGMTGLILLTGPLLYGTSLIQPMWLDTLLGSVLFALSVFLRLWAHPRLQKNVQ